MKKTLKPKTINKPQKMVLSTHKRKQPKRSELLCFEIGHPIRNHKILNNLAKTTAGIAEPLGEGGSGIVFLAEQTLHKKITIKRAIKFFMYRDDIANLTLHDKSEGISSKDFLNEIVNISGFSHEHLVKVIDAGLYPVNGFDVPYIVTDFIEGPTLKHITDLAEESKGPTQDNDSVNLQKRIKENPENILHILIQIATGLEFLHDRSFLHCDIAPKNIFLKRNENYKAIIGDLGAGKTLKRKGKWRVIGTKSYMPPEIHKYLYKSVTFDQFNSFFPRWDIYAFAKTGLALIKVIENNTHLPWIIPTKTMFNDAISGVSYKDISEILTRLRWLLSVNRSTTNVPELSPTLLTKKRRLMPVESLATTERVSLLTWHPALLRLAKVPQLTAARHTFPGAIHTRYEHSLGTMETMRRYLMNLVGQNSFQDHLNASKIETALLCSLFSSLLRFPFSTIIREIRGIPSNLIKVFSKKDLLKDIFCIKDSNGDTLPDLVKKLFPNVDIGCVINILTDEKSTFTKEDELIYSLLNSSLDVRVVDFVRRDSLHLGISRQTFDLDELLAHLTIHQHKLAISVTGVSTAEEIITMRYTLFNRIYWNRPNRMLVSIIRHIILALANETFLKKLRKEILNATEMDILTFLEEELYDASRNDLINLIEVVKEDGHKPFKVILEASPKEDADLSVVCHRFREMNNIEAQELAGNLTNEIRDYFAKPLDMHNFVPLLVDMPFEPGSGNKLGDDILVIYPQKGEARSENLCRMRIFIHPEFYPNTNEAKVGMKQRIKEYLLRTVQ
jgi:HD superfamily phosphohydrolase